MCSQLNEHLGTISKNCVAQRIEKVPIGGCATAKNCSEFCKQKIVTFKNAVILSFLRERLFQLIKDSN